MYENLISIMKTEGITFLQLGELLQCRYQTVSDTVNGVMKKGFSFDDACKIQKVFFPQYDIYYLFKRNITQNTNECSISLL